MLIPLRMQYSAHLFFFLSSFARGFFEEKQPKHQSTLEVTNVMIVTSTPNAKVSSADRSCDIVRGTRHGEGDDGYLWIGRAR